MGENEAVTAELPGAYKKFGSDVALVGGTLAVELVAPGKDAGAAFGAFSATTGELLWEWRDKRGSFGVPLAHRGCLPTLHGYGDRATVLDPADGRVVARRRLPGHGFRPRLAAHGDHLAVACTAVRDIRRLRVFRWR